MFGLYLQENQLQIVQKKDYSLMHWSKQFIATYCRYCQKYYVLNIEIDKLQHWKNSGWLYGGCKVELFTKLATSYYFTSKI